MQLLITLSIFLALLLILGYLGVPLWAWTLYGAAVLTGVHFTLGIPLWAWITIGIIALILNIPLLRQWLVSVPLMQMVRKLNLLPTISDTEKAAIEAGTVWVEREFFSGKPNFDRLLQEPYPQISPDIRAFLDGPVEQVCKMATDWEIYTRKDLPPDVWRYLKQERFFGMMIPKEYGGMGFSTLAYSAVMTKLASRSFTHTATVGVTNSLGPAKLLLRYGTAAQKDYYLPRLATGDEIPCFALTEPHAGSDAASITSSGVVFQGNDDQLYLRLNWNKRYITLGAIATLLGLAFRLYDPDNLLGKGKEVGITCALIPTNTPGVVLGRRHDPMGVPFYNSPTEGHDVVIPADYIIGGLEQAGNGWRMLMQTLAAGRGISFPATCTGVAKLVSRTTGAYAVVRKQFGLPIGRFEGIEEPLARIAGLTYLLDAARLYTVGAVDQGEQPAVVSAIAKYQFTELSRKIINDGMDVLGGAGICRGPRNLLANIYTAIPIPITVEGANILTRTLIIFGQGAIRCHPYVYDEVTAIQQNRVRDFDRAFWAHLGTLVRNGFRAELLSLTRGAIARSPVSGPTARYYKQLVWASASFAYLTDLALLSFGGSLKRQEKLTGRFADMLSWLYLATATLRRFEAEGHNPDDLPFVDWAMQHAVAQIQNAVEGILENWSTPVLGWMLRGPVATWWRLNPIGTPPDDALGHRVARLLQTPGSMRDRLTNDIFIPTDTTEALGRLEHAFHLSTQADAILKALKGRSSIGRTPSTGLAERVDAAVSQGLISADDAEVVKKAIAARDDAIQVDSFTLGNDQAYDSPRTVAATGKEKAIARNIV
ncbi:MAG: acyl-CoA dehydrogenase [Cyanobacteria bacterium P01_E01_bin.6]